jgi:hypothetical protein
MDPSTLNRKSTSDSSQAIVRSEVLAGWSSASITRVGEPFEHVSAAQIPA